MAIMTRNGAAARVSDEGVDAVRRFNRFYTRQIGLLREGMLDSPYSLSEARVLYELAHREKPTATEIGIELGLDAGYLSRMLRGFERRGLIRRTPSKDDGRSSLLALTKEGRRVFAPLNTRSNKEARAILETLPGADRKRLVEAMKTVEELLAPERDTSEPFTIRTHRPGDLGWMVSRHGAVYVKEYGLDDNFEALVAEIAAKFLRHNDPMRERCWIAERRGERVGCVMLVQESDEVGKLRLLLVEPDARGYGIGRRLVDECIGFARQAGYRKIVLWTSAVLMAARRIYENAGFHLVAEERHRMFGPEWVGQTWELEL